MRTQERAATLWALRDLDWERGRVAFYDGRSLDLLFAFQAPGPLGERVFPLLCTCDPRAPLRIVPGEA